MTEMREGNGSQNSDAASRLWREILWAWKCWRHYNREVYRAVSPHRPPAKTVARLRERVLSGKWD